MKLEQKQYYIDNKNNVIVFEEQIHDIFWFYSIETGCYVAYYEYELENIERY